MQPQAELIVQWLRRAQDDLSMVELALNNSPPLCWNAAFHAQQAAEKLLKGLLTFHGVEFAKTHQIDYLLDMCVTVEPEADSLRADATKLTDFAVEPRYPLPGRDPSESESREAVEVACRVRQFVLALLPGEIRDQAFPPSP